MVLKRTAKDAHSREKKMSLTRPRSAREFRERNSLFFHRKDLVILTCKSRCLSYEKTLREDRTAAEWQMLLTQPAAGGESCGAGFFFKRYIIAICGISHIIKYVGTNTVDLYPYGKRMKVLQIMRTLCSCSLPTESSMYLCSMIRLFVHISKAICGVENSVLQVLI